MLREKLLSVTPSIFKYFHKLRHFIPQLLAEVHQIVQCDGLTLQQSHNVVPQPASAHNGLNAGFSLSS